MIIRSLGYRTDLIFPSFDGQIIDHGEFLVVCTPTNPTFYWGNFLLFSHPPKEGDYSRWLDLFVQHIGTLPEIEHLVFAWDSPEGELGYILPFLQTGFRLDRSDVMVSSKLKAPLHPSKTVSIRPLQTPDDWEQAVENQVACREAEFEENEFRAFSRKQMSRYRNMSASGLGNWYGAFLGKHLVADLGVFHDGNGLGRFQSVQTHPNFRRQGIAGTLVYEAGRQTMDRYGLHTLVIVADLDSNAARLYQSMDYKPTEQQVGLERWPGMEVEISLY